ncbi:PspC domain-containing protein [Smaragdicoccus niigatensis]|uniref:PspC domain-containing protein n=1 Tax=Smaragdicoccus niigatensis TaxID=359359 RepID=UPI0003717842|nr:PspC domain-containing protein [Smaragdicoccus niigatensis]
MATLVRTRDGKMIAGVCSGIARTYGWDTTVVRLVFLLSCLLPGPQFLIYLVLWIVIPQEKEPVGYYAPPVVTTHHDV